jgi:hypothetical protein
MAELTISVYPTPAAEYVSILPFEHVFQHGLAPEAIIGQLTRPLAEAEQITPDVFAANSVFRAFLHRFIARSAPLDPDLQAAAQQQFDGYLYVLDQRTPAPRAAVPREDIVGYFEVRGGVVSPESYVACPGHRLLSQNGFFQLGDRMQRLLISELEQLATA